MISMEPTHPNTLRVDIWSDVACPWCFVGKHRFEEALQGFAHKDSVEVVWHAYELYPDNPARREESAETYFTNKHGHTRAKALAGALTSAASSVGLAYDCAHLKMANTFRAHQLIALAGERGRGTQMKERLLRAYFTQGADLSQTDTLIGLAKDAGLDEDDARKALELQTYAEHVREDEAHAAELGITGVPFFVLGGRYALNGAQRPEVFADALQEAWGTRPKTAIRMGGSESAEGCEDGSCAV
jgi:predicted DsbA family dithiol-disulfide isomerase